MWEVISEIKNGKKYLKNIQVFRNVYILWTLRLFDLDIFHTFYFFLWISSYYFDQADSTQQD